MVVTPQNQKKGLAQGLGVRWIISPPPTSRRWITLLINVFFVSDEAVSYLLELFLNKN
jgi:hypothetical protein